MGPNGWRTAVPLEEHRFPLHLWASSRALGAGWLVPAVARQYRLVAPPTPDVETIAATMRFAQADEDLCARPVGLALEVLDGPDASIHRVDGDEITVGRGALCDVTLTDPSVSEFHFRLSADVGQVVLEDLGSSNGIWIGRARVTRAHLVPGARFRAGAVRMQLRDIETAPTAVTKREEFFGLRGQSQEMRSIFSLLSRFAPTPLPVLVTGETGVGKGMIARALHQASGRSGRLVVVDCTALPRELADGLLFGHIKGSFTGATSDRLSPFEEADGGTLFLDEIGELPLELQPKLLRTIDELTVQRLGSNEPKKVDLRLVAATNRNLLEEVSSGRFRADLYHRLAGVPIRVPPLRNRKDDVLFLASKFLEDVCAQIGQPIALGEEVADDLLRLNWPGNARELRQTIFRAAYLCEGSELCRRDLLQNDEMQSQDISPASAANGTPQGPPLQEQVREFKRDYCLSLLARSSTMTAAAREAGFTPKGFRVLLKKLGIEGRKHLAEHSS